MLAADLSQEFRLDWDDAEILDDDWDDMIAGLRNPPPGAPNRLVLECGTEAGFGEDRDGGISEALKLVERPESSDWDLLGNRMSARPHGRKRFRVIATFSPMWMPTRSNGSTASTDALPRNPLGVSKARRAPTTR
ncbi:hypothetical protein [Roseobacter sp. HKCCA0434]|uniref:hypothetical protein n=1 Tax=Roseobacter sp. HKCCA0434 TaxID=3079297 RepID=UPI002905ED0D|nr:hypothetical protein [Roseobacter sp. HKCCA0434]